MRESGPRERIDLQDVVQELDQFIGAGADLLDSVGLRDGVEIAPHMVDTAAGRRHDIVETGEVAHEQRLRVGRFRVEPAVCHRLAATCLIVWVRDVVAESFQELERRDADLRKKRVDVAWDEKPDAHASPRFKWCQCSGHQLKTETISPCGFEKVLSNTSVSYFEDLATIRSARACLAYGHV